MYQLISKSSATERIGQTKDPGRQGSLTSPRACMPWQRIVTKAVVINKGRNSQESVV